jgi:hypothetical protein
MLIDVSLLKENADGSAVFSFELSEDMKDALLRFGIMKAIEAGIEASKELHPSFEGAPEWTPEDTAYRPGGLAQPEQEPVAWICQEYRAAFMGDLQWFDEVEFMQPPNDPERFRNIVPLYTSPPQRQPLTHEQRLDLLTAFEEWKHDWNAESILIDMVEAAHGIGDKT